MINSLQEPLQSDASSKINAANRNEVFARIRTQPLQRHCIIVQTGSKLLEPRGQSNVTRTDKFRQKHKSHRVFLNLYLYAKN
jgi:hypothetical protein